MKEYNRESLRKALDRLPQYDPAPQNWSEIAGALDRTASAASTGTHRAAPDLNNRLPQYSPPPSVWNQINEQLNQPAAAARPLRRRWPAALWRVAAAVALLVGSYAIYQSLDRGPEITYSYRKETNFEPTFVADWRQEEPQFQSLAEDIADSDNPAVNRLRTELEELTSARGDVEAMLENYGHDPHLVRQLGEIERERSELYRQLIVYR
jgi:hypothetical protein